MNSEQPKPTRVTISLRQRWLLLSKQIDRFLKKLKPNSTAVRTTLLVSFVGLFSLFMSLAFFWRTLYLPEIRQHAHYLAINLELIREAEQQVLIDPFALDIHEWILERVGVEFVRDPAEFPSQRTNPLANFFTSELSKELSTELKEPVSVFFGFKPTPQLWIHFPSLGNVWIREPLLFYAQYDAALIIGWLLGIPLLTSIIILILVRQLNRPLALLQTSARRYTITGETPKLRVDSGPVEIRQVNTAFNQMISSLEQAAHDRTIMLAGISHDLRTPLTRMRLTAELMPDEDLREGMVYDIADMDEILAQFISYMRDGSDEETQLADINQILQEIVIQYKSSNILYQPQILPKISIRPLSIKRMVGNIVNNALRYGREPIYISATLLPTQLTLTIRDCGDGIQLDDLNSLTEPFVRGESARTTQGSGLGLAIVKRIAGLHGGMVNVHNHHEGGLEVSVTLPIYPSKMTSPNPKNKRINLIHSEVDHD
ncbi:ATP-binding protein [Aquirhabdus sp.]|uniref:ATP-binding protein n=1 Tax=Aquirhabdus sp. TaxID=2824160 RepID=UPI00396CC66F